VSITWKVLIVVFILLVGISIYAQATGYSWGDEFVMATYQPESGEWSIITINADKDFNKTGHGYEAMLEELSLYHQRKVR